MNWFDKSYFDACVPVLSELLTYGLKNCKAFCTFHTEYIVSIIFLLSSHSFVQNQGSWCPGGQDQRIGRSSSQTQQRQPEVSGLVAMKFLPLALSDKLSDCLTADLCKNCVRLCPTISDLIWQSSLIPKNQLNDKKHHWATNQCNSMVQQEVIRWQSYDSFSLLSCFLQVPAMFPCETRWTVRRE